LSKENLDGAILMTRIQILANPCLLMIYL